MDLITKYRNKKILIFGFGREGESSLSFFRSLFPNKVVGVYDKKNYQSLSSTAQKFIKDNPKIKFYSGEDYKQIIKNYDVIIRSPGINPSLILSKKERDSKQIEVTSQTKIFFQNTTSTIIGVTGTKGKSTTASLIFRILQLDTKDQSVKLVGNINKPVLSEALRSKTSFGDSRKTYVYELSSHQLCDLEKSPHIAIILNLFPDHLDYFKNFEEYKKAKTNILRHQSDKDILIYNADEVNLLEVIKKSPAQKFSYSLYSRKVNCFLANDSFYFSKKGNGVIEDSEKILNIKEVSLLGQFNFQNIMPAIITAKIMGRETKLIKARIQSFKPLPHHLFFVQRSKGIDFYNDSIATVPQATIAGLKALGNSVETLIIGGSSKELEMQQLSNYLFENSSVKTLLLFAPTGIDIREKLIQQKEANPEKKIPQMFNVKSMEEAVRLAYKYTDKKKICLLSPASASFNLFKNYKDRGNVFMALVKKIGDER